MMPAHHHLADSGGPASLTACKCTEPLSAVELEKFAVESDRRCWLPVQKASAKQACTVRYSLIRLSNNLANSAAGNVVYLESCCANSNTITNSRLQVRLPKQQPLQLCSASLCGHFDDKLSADLLRVPLRFASLTAFVGQLFCASFSSSLAVNI